MLKRAMFIKLVFAALFVAVLPMPTTGCSEIDEAVDCNAFCDKYKSCIDDSVAVLECTDKCEDWADESQANADRIDACHECIEDHSCLSATATCITECSFIPVRK